jgi:addiction module RelB/DinJ family antitoxin
LDNTLTVATAPKTGTFQMRINPEIKAQVEQIYARCGMTMTDAINAFLQQSINVEGLPFLMTQNSKEALREQAIAQLMLELKKGEDSVQSEADWVSEEELLHEFGVAL